MNSYRRTAFLLILTLGLFAAVCTGVMMEIYARELYAGVLATPEITSLKERLKTDANNEALKDEARWVDAQLRAEHQRNRDRLKWGAYLLLATLIGWVASARWFVALGKVPEPAILAGKQEINRPAWVAAAVAVAGAVVLLALGYLALFNRPVLPTAAQSLASSQPPAAGSAPASGPASGPVIAAQPASVPTVAVSAEFKEYWPGFRGPGGIGVASAGDWPTTWSLPKKTNIAWSVEVPYDAPSSPIVWADRLFLTGAEENTGHVLCFNRSTGEQLWDKSVEPPAGKKYEVPEETGAAVPTPCTDGRRVYAMFATGLLAAFDFDGKQQWLADIGPLDSGYGFASSPMATENLVILQADQGNTPKAGLSALFGFDAATGKVAWKTPRPVRGSWSSPALIPTESRPELITTCEPFITAYDPKTGAELWKVEGLEGNVAPSATFGGGLVFAAEDGSELFAIRPGGSGDVTETNVVWKGEDGLPDVASPVTDGERVLQVAAGGYVTCYDAQKGQLVWETYLPNSASASPIVAGGRAYITSEDGLTTVLDISGAKARIVAKSELGEAVRATPAFADSRIYLRGEKHLACVGVK